MSWHRFPLLLSMMAGLAQPALAEAVTLEQVIRLALSESPAVEAAEAVYAGSEADTDAARARRGWQVALQGSLGTSQTDFTQGRIDQSPRQLGLVGELPLYASGTLRSGVEAAHHRANAAGYLVADAREAAILQATEAFATTWLAGRLADVAEAEVHSLVMRQREAQARFEQGQITMTDVAMASSRLASAQSRLAVAKAGLATAQVRLASLAGRSGLRPVLSFSPLGLPSGLTEEEAVTIALAHNPSLAAARLGRSEVEARLTGIRGEFGPQVSLRARVTASEDTYFFFGDPITEAGVFIHVEVPLLTSGLRTAREQRVAADRRVVLASLRERELFVSEGVRSLWAEQVVQDAGLEAARIAEQSARLAAEGMRAEYAAGLRTLVDALDADADLRKAQAARLSAEVAVLVTQARLLAMLGRLETSLGSAVSDRVPPPDDPGSS